MLHYTTVRPATLGLLKSLMAREYLNDFVLVGGTNLALQLGHRYSVDLDFFTNNTFNAEQLESMLREDYTLNDPQVMTGNTLIVEAENVKLDFIRFKYVFSFPFIREDGIVLLDIRDVAPMKIDAITARGKKKDFYDLFFLLQNFGLEEMMTWYDQMFHKVTVFHVWKSLTYFEDAEKDIDPVVFDKSVTWSRVKDAIRTEIRKL